MNTDFLLIVIQDNPFKLWLGSKVQQQANFKGRRLEIVQHLRFMRSVEALSGFQLQQNSLVYNKVGSKFTHYMASEIDWQRYLRLYLQTGLSERESKCSLVDALQESGPELVVNVVKDTYDGVRDPRVYS